MNRPILLSIALICFAPLAYELNNARGMNESNGIFLFGICMFFGIAGLLIGLITREKEQPHLVIDGSES